MAAAKIFFGEDRLKSNPEFLFDYDILTWMNTGITSSLKSFKLNKKIKNQILFNSRNSMMF